MFLSNDLLGVAEQIELRRRLPGWRGGWRLGERQLVERLGEVALGAAFTP
jgi:hypothetical protein